MVEGEAWNKAQKIKHFPVVRICVFFFFRRFIVHPKASNRSREVKPERNSSSVNLNLIKYENKEWRMHFVPAGNVLVVLNSTKHYDIQIFSIDFEGLLSIEHLSFNGCTVGRETIGS